MHNAHACYPQEMADSSKGRKARSPHGTVSEKKPRPSLPAEYVTVFSRRRDAPEVRCETYGAPFVSKIETLSMRSSSITSMLKIDRSAFEIDRFVPKLIYPSKLSVDAVNLTRPFNYSLAHEHQHVRARAARSDCFWLLDVTSLEQLKQATVAASAMEEARNLLAYELIECTLSTAYIIVSSIIGAVENFLTEVFRLAPIDKAQEFEEVMQYLFAPFPAFSQHMYTSCG